MSRPHPALSLALSWERRRGRADRRSGGSTGLWVPVSIGGAPAASVTPRLGGHHGGAALARLSPMGGRCRLQDGHVQGWGMTSRRPWTFPVAGGDLAEVRSPQRAVAGAHWLQEPRAGQPLLLLSWMWARAITMARVLELPESEAAGPAPHALAGGSSSQPCERAGVTVVKSMGAGASLPLAV